MPKTAKSSTDLTFFFFLSKKYPGLQNIFFCFFEANPGNENKWYDFISFVLKGGNIEGSLLFWSQTEWKATNMMHVPCKTRSTVVAPFPKWVLGWQNTCHHTQTHNPQPPTQQTLHTKVQVRSRQAREVVARTVVGLQCHNTQTLTNTSWNSIAACAEQFFGHPFLLL